MRRRAGGFTLIELMIAVAIIGILAALAIPNFIRFQARSKQAEARANLKALFTAEKSYFAAHDAYSSKVLDVGFSPERNNRYAYLLAADISNLDDRSGTVVGATSATTGISADLFKYPTGNAGLSTTPACASALGVSPSGLSFTGAAMGNIDGDSTLDQWTISTDSRSLPATCDTVGANPAGEPANELSDVNR